MIWIIMLIEKKILIVLIHSTVSNTAVAILLWKIDCAYSVCLSTDTYNDWVLPSRKVGRITIQLEANGWLRWYKVYFCIDIQMFTLTFCGCRFVIIKNCRTTEFHEDCNSFCWNIFKTPEYCLSMIHVKRGRLMKNIFKKSHSELDNSAVQCSTLFLILWAPFFCIMIFKRFTQTNL